MLRSSGWTTRNVAVATSRRSAQALPEAFHHGLVGRHHVAVQLRQRDLRARARQQPEQAERRVGPPHEPGDQVLLPAAETAEPLGVIEQHGQRRGPVRRGVTTPGEDHAVEEPGRAQIGQIGGFLGREPAGQGFAERPGNVLRHAVRQDLHGAGEQAPAGRARRVRLQQGQPGQVRSRPAPGIAETRADVLDAEVGHLSAVIPDRLHHEHRVGHAVQQGVDGRLRLGGSQAAVREAGADDPRAARGERGQVLARLRAELRQRLRPARLHHAEQLAVPLTQREHRPAAVRAADDRRGVVLRTTRVPPQVCGAPGDALSGTVKLRRDVPPAADLAAGQPRLAEER